MNLRQRFMVWHYKRHHECYYRPSCTFCRLRNRYYKWRMGARE